MSSEEKLKYTINKSFMKLSGRLRIAKRWAVKFLNKNIIAEVINDK